jgi:hypothetical protein
MLREAGLSQPSQLPARSKPEKSPASFWKIWKKIPAWAYFAFAAFSVGITLLEGYPWLSVEESGFLDPSDPFSQMFKLANGGYVPVTDLFAGCSADTSVNGYVFKDTGINLPLADYLGHEGSVTLPCFEMFRLHGAVVPSGSDLKITITYAFFHLNWKPIRRSQEFHFKSIVGSDHSQHWIFVE